MINRYIEVTDEYIKQLEHEIDDLKAINEEHKKINGKLREENKFLMERENKLQNIEMNEKSNKYIKSIKKVLTKYLKSIII